MLVPGQVAEDKIAFRWHDQAFEGSAVVDKLAVGRTGVLN